MHIVDQCHIIQYPATSVVDKSIALPDTTAINSIDSIQHRNARRSRQIARGIFTAEKLGYIIPSKDVAIAYNHLVPHHGIAPATTIQCYGKRTWDSHYGSGLISQVQQMVNMDYANKM